MAARIELTLMAKGLINKDFAMNKSDPFCVVRRMDGGAWVSVGHTEVVNSNLNPVWKKKFVLEHRAGLGNNNLLKFDIFDKDKKGDSEPLGCAEVHFDHLVNAPNGSTELVLAHPNPKKAGKAGKITIMAERINPGHGEIVTLQFSGEKLDDKDAFGKSDPFLMISKKAPNGDFVFIKRTETINNNLNPNWKAFTVPMELLCNGQKDRALRIEVRDEDGKGKSELIGLFEANLLQLCQAAAEGGHWTLFNEERAKKKKDKYQGSGLIMVKRCNIGN